MTVAVVESQPFEKKVVRNNTGGLWEKSGTALATLEC
jgi:hypothetical protein